MGPSYIIDVVRSHRRSRTISASAKRKTSNASVIIEVRVPARLPGYAIQQFIDQNTTAFARLVEHFRAANPTPRTAAAGEIYLLQNETITLKILTGHSRRRPHLEYDADTRSLWLFTAQPLPDAKIRRLLTQWYRHQARTVLTARTRHWSQEMGISYNQIRIKDMRSRWGSCSSLGNLNYKWQIVMAPDEIIDYLVIHELAHRRQPNHSPAFWAVVADFDPGYKAHRRWLRQQGNQLNL